ncbi:MAG: Hpt domain-containing protein [Thermoguttaceae bacterium]
MADSEAVARDEFFESLLGDFLDESGQLLDRLNENLLQLDEWVRSLDEDHNERCDDDLMNDMFRSAHSLKGLSAMLGLTDINDLTHKVENVFDAARKDELVISGDCVELMFQAVDRLVAMVDSLKEPTGQSVNCNQVLQGISGLLQRAGAERKKSSQADAEKALADLMPAGQPSSRSGRRRPPGCLRPRPRLPLPSSRPRSSLRRPSRRPFRPPIPSPASRTRPKYPPSISASSSTRPRWRSTASPKPCWRWKAVGIPNPSPHSW